MKSLKEKMFSIFHNELDDILEKQNKPKVKIEPKLNKNFSEDLNSTKDRIDKIRCSIQNTKK